MTQTCQSYILLLPSHGSGYQSWIGWKFYVKDKKSSLTRNGFIPCWEENLNPKTHKKLQRSLIVVTLVEIHGKKSSCLKLNLQQTGTQNFMASLNQTMKPVNKHISNMS